MPRHTEGNQTESEDTPGKPYNRRDRWRRQKISDSHQADHNQAFPESGKVSGNDTGDDVKRCPGFAAGVDDFLNMLRFGRSEYFGELSGIRAAAKVPQLMMTDSFHHRSGPILPIMTPRNGKSDGD